MCGISGYFSRQYRSAETLTRMNDSMEHRGPDDAGVEFYEGRDGWKIGLAQRRLSILDLSPLGHQPMTSPDGRVSIVYNGEIYNYLEIEQELSDYPFRSTCDTEMILAAYLKWGIHCVDRFNGMFAIAIYDRKTEELFLVRDRMGVKPLYYWTEDPTGIAEYFADPARDFHAGGEKEIGSAAGLVFASELKPIMLCPGFTREIRKDVLPRYLFQQYINAPETIFRNVWKVEPGTILRFAGGRLYREKYWDTATVYHQMQQQPVTDFAEAKAALKRLLQRATKLRMISDVPLGCFLSGGYDSSLVSALAQEQLGSTPLRTFAIGFNEKSYNEAGFAKEVAQHLGCDHTELYIDEKEMLDLVDSIPQYFDEPFADSSQIPTMLVSMLARQKVTVALSGDAGDEFYCGYNIYENVAQAQQLDGLGALAHGLGQLPAGKGRLESHYPFRVRVIAANRNPETKTQFGAGSYVDFAYRMAGYDPAEIAAADAKVLRWLEQQQENRTGGSHGARSGKIPEWLSIPVNYETERSYGVANWQIRRMLLDMDTYLPGDIMTKVDRASMKYSLENRCPILDKDVMEYSYRIDHSFKCHQGVRKYILKELAYDYIPKELLDRPKKGFGVPLDQWLRGPLRKELEDYADRDYLQRQGLFDADFTSRMIQNYLKTGDGGPATGRNFSKLSWSFFVFQQWYQKYCAM